LTNYYFNGIYIDNIVNVGDKQVRGYQSKKVSSQPLKDNDGNQSSDETSNIQTLRTVNGDSQQGRICSTPKPVNVQYSKSISTGKTCVHNYVY
jgi:hypothetical protein